MWTIHPRFSSWSRCHTWLPSFKKVRVQFHNLLHPQTLHMCEFYSDKNNSSSTLLRGAIYYGSSLEAASPIQLVHNTTRNSIFNVDFLHAHQLHHFPLALQIRSFSLDFCRWSTSYWARRQEAAHGIPSAVLTRCKKLHRNEFGICWIIHLLGESDSEVQFRVVWDHWSKCRIR